MGVIGYQIVIKNQKLLPVLLPRPATTPPHFHGPRLLPTPPVRDQFISCLGPPKSLSSVIPSANKFNMYSEVYVIPPKTSNLSTCVDTFFGNLKHFDFIKYRIIEYYPSLLLCINFNELQLEADTSLHIAQ